MDNVEPRDQFNSEDELRKLLESWVTPDPPRSLDQRVTNSFAREVASANLQAESVLLSQKQKEVVAMKFCSTCNEEFADKFSFCPVDGTPLNSVAARVDESITKAKDRSETIQSPVEEKLEFVPPPPKEEKRPFVLHVVPQEEKRQFVPPAPQIAAASASSSGSTHHLMP